MDKRAKEREERKKVLDEKKRLQDEERLVSIYKNYVRCNIKDFKIGMSIYIRSRSLIHF